jgi:Calx-beta domain
MMNFIWQKQDSGWLAVGRMFGGTRRSARREPPRWSGTLETLESRELLSTTQDFTTPGTAYSLQQIGGLPVASVQTGGPTGNYLLLATTPTTPLAGNNNSISFVTSDVGTYDNASASWDFRVTPQSGLDGLGMSFALLNTANYGTSGGAASTVPQQGLYNGSLAFGFDTTNNIVYASMNGGIVTAVPAGMTLATGQFITANAAIDFVNGTVSLALTPSGGSPVTVFSSTPIAGLTPYQSRVSLQANNSGTNFAEFDVDNINVQWSGLRQAGTIQFGSAAYSVAENAGSIQIDVVRTGGTAGSELVSYVTADDTARNGVNYTAVAGSLTFAEGVSLQTFTIPIYDDHLYTTNKTVLLFLSNPTLTAPLGSPIAATLTIVNTDLPAPTVSAQVTKVYLPHTRRVSAFRLTFSQAMDATAAQNLNNYVVSMPPARKGGKPRTVALSSAVLDPSGLFVTLYRANVGVHLTKLIQIIVRGKPTTGLISTTGTFLAGAGGVSGTDAILRVSI